MRVFIDTNLWAYRLDKRDIAKSDFAARWLRETAREHDIVISTQVMIELRAVLTHKFQPAWSASDVRIALQALATFEVVTSDANLVLEDRFQHPDQRLLDNFVLDAGHTQWASAPP